MWFFSSDLVAQLKQRRLVWNTLSVLTAGAFAACIVFWDFRHVVEFTLQATDYTDDLTRRLPKDLPVVCEDAFTFTDLIGRQHASGVHYMFLLDWKQSIAPTAPRLEVTQYHLMENWRNVGYFSGSIEPIDAFLREHSKFLVIHAGPPASLVPPAIGNPIAERLSATPGYDVRKYASVDRRTTTNTVWMVCKGTCSQ